MAETNTATAPPAPQAEAQGLNQATNKPPWEATAPSTADKSPASAPALATDKPKGEADKQLTEANKSDTIKSDTKSEADKTGAAKSEAAKQAQAKQPQKIQQNRALRTVMLNKRRQSKPPKMQKQPQMLILQKPPPHPTPRKKTALPNGGADRPLHLIPKWSIQP